MEEIDIHRLSRLAENVIFLSQAPRVVRPSTTAQEKLVLIRALTLIDRFKPLAGDDEPTLERKNMFLLTELSKVEGFEALCEKLRKQSEEQQKTSPK